jgi:hypothetical protein
MTHIRKAMTSIGQPGWNVFEEMEVENIALRTERDKLHAALEQLIRDYEDEVGEKAMAARRALEK